MDFTIALGCHRDWRRNEKEGQDVDSSINGTVHVKRRFEGNIKVWG